MTMVTSLVMHSSHKNDRPRDPVAPAHRTPAPYYPLNLFFYISGMVRENLFVDTSFDAFIYSENAIFSSLVTVLTLKWRERRTRYFFLTGSSEYCCIHFAEWPF